MNLNQRMKGLSLKVGPLGENDRLLTILSEESGISRLAIPGARKPKSRLGATSPFNLLDLHIVGKKDLKKVTQIKIIKSYGNLGKNIETLSAAQAISELILIMVGNEDPQKDLLKLVLMHLNRLNELHKTEFNSLEALAISVQSCIHLLALGGGFNTWPKMLGEWVPEAVYYDSNGYNSIWFLEHSWGVQFIHRKLAIILVALFLSIWYYGRKQNILRVQKNALNIIMSLIILQTIIGILTLIYAAPIAIASIHQIMAFLLLMSIVYALFLFKNNLK